MTAPEVSCRVSIVLHTFEANDAVADLFPLYALVIIFVQTVKTAFAIIAMKGVFFGTLSAASTFFTMIQSLLVSLFIVEGTGRAKVLSEVFLAIDAFAFLGLLSVAS